MPWLLMNWKLVLLGLLIASTAMFYKLWREDVRAFNAYKIEVAALGKAAEMEKQRIEKSDKLNKERTDAENVRTTAGLKSELARLRNANSGRGNLSGPAPSPGSPDRTCFDPAKFDDALRVLDQDILGIVETGSQAVIDLDSAKEWAKGR